MPCFYHPRTEISHELKCQVYAVLGIQPQILCMVGQQSTNGAKSTACVKMHFTSLSRMLGSAEALSDAVSCVSARMPDKGDLGREAFPPAHFSFAPSRQRKHGRVSDRGSMPLGLLTV